MTDLTHIDEHGRARMVDVSDKPATRRIAKAQAVVSMSASALMKVRDNAIGKGDVLTVAQIAGIQAAKRTDQLIPLCHGLPLSHIGIEFAFGDTGITIIAEAITTAQTGVEMEALTAASIAALAIYDMVKAVDRTIRIDAIHLLQKTGGRTGDFQWQE